jgi:hypothetical protein
LRLPDASIDEIAARSTPDHGFGSARRHSPIVTETQHHGVGGAGPHAAMLRALRKRRGRVPV